MRTELLRFNGAVEQDPAIEAWMKEHAGELGAIAHQWFEVMRKCGDEVRELLHDGCPVACLGDAPFGYVNVFTSHVNIGFFHGASLSDPARLLQGNGKSMRHVKLRPGMATNAAAQLCTKSCIQTIFLACEAGESIKPGALAPGQRDVTNQAREAGESPLIFKLSPASRAAHETAPYLGLTPQALCSRLLRRLRSS